MVSSVTDMLGHVEPVATWRLGAGPLHVSRCPHRFAIPGEPGEHVCRDCGEPVPANDHGNALVRAA